MNTRTRTIAAFAAGILALSLSACTGDDDASPTSSTSQTESATSTTTTSATSSTTASTTSSMPSETPEPESVVEEPPAVEAEPAAAAPYVVECLQGAPGPALWSDGTTAYSQGCFDEATAGRDHRCPHTDHYVTDPSECEPIVIQPGGDRSTWDYEGPQNENGDPLDHPQLNWPE